MSKPCIPCVVGDQERLEALVWALEQRFGHTHEILGLGSGRDCVQAVERSVARDQPVPLVLSDSELPDMAGAQLLAVIHGSHPEVMKALLTEASDPDVDADRLARAGVNQCLRKPWQPEPLFLSVETLLKQYELGRRLAQSRKALQQRNARLEALHEIGMALASTFDIDAILDQITQATALLVGDDAPIDVYYAGSRTLNARARWSPATPTVDGLSLPERRELEGKAGSLTDITELSDRDRDASEPEPALGTSRRSRFVVPFTRQENVLGVIVVDPKRPPSEEDRGLLSILALQAATALHNIHLTQQRIHFERLSAVGRMVGSVVHDFRSPLTTVRGYARMMASPELPDEDRRAYARLIVEECDRLGGLSQELLELTRGSGVKPKLRPVALEDFMTSLRPSLEAQFMDSDIRLTTDFAYRGLVQLDTERMTRAILNVATNARQAMSDGGSFRVRSRRVGQQVRLEFQDSGCGIPADVLHRISEPFFSYGKAHGVGLGMWTIRRIVEEHNGAIEIDSRIGVGTTVRFSLPLAVRNGEDPSSKLDAVERSHAGSTAGRSR